MAKRPVLHLPDMAKLVHDEILGRIHVADEDRPVQRESVEAAEPRQPEEPRGPEQANVLHPDGPRIPVELVEPRLGADDRGMGHPVVGVSSRAAVPSPGRVW
jgi:hypothetical protein